MEYREIHMEKEAIVCLPFGEFGTELTLSHSRSFNWGFFFCWCFFFCLPILLPWILLPAASSLRWGRALINHRLCMLRIIFGLSSTSRRVRGGGVLDSSWHMRRQSIDDVRYSIGRLMNRCLTLRVHLRSAICNDSSATLIAACFSSSY